MKIFLLVLLYGEYMYSMVSVDMNENIITYARKFQTNKQQKKIANEINVNYSIKMLVALGIVMHNVYREGRYMCTCSHA